MSRLPAATLAATLCAVTLLGTATPAWAETIYLRNGTQITGKITKEDAKAFSVETAEGRRKVPKSDVERWPPPDPGAAAVLSLFPGAGHLYVGDYTRGVMFMALGAAAGTAGFFIGGQMRPHTPGAAAVGGLVGAEVIAMLAGLDAYAQAKGLTGAVRYHIVYD